MVSSWDTDAWGGVLNEDAALIGGAGDPKMEGFAAWDGCPKVDDCFESGVEVRNLLKMESVAGVVLKMLVV